ncbi:hypothetical protein Tco_0690366 [Tanacetum coccineum]
MQKNEQFVKIQDRSGKDYHRQKDNELKISTKRRSRKTVTKAKDQRLQIMKEQAYNIIKTKDSRTQQQSNLTKVKGKSIGYLLEEPQLREDLLDRNANLPPTINHPVLPAALRARAVQELWKISAFIDSRLESIERFLNRFTDQPNETSINDLESDDESVDTPLVSPFPHSDNDSDDGEVLNELLEYENVRMLHREKAINGFDGEGAFILIMIGFRNLSLIFDTFLPITL